MTQILSRQVWVQLNILSEFRGPPLKELLDELLKDCKTPEDLLGKNGVLKQLTKDLMERMLEAEMTDHLGYDRHALEGRGSGNSRNGTSAKTIQGDHGEVPLDVPRDRNGDFEPQVIPKGQRRLPGFDEKVISMYARGMTTREIQGHLHELYGVEVSSTLISNITDAVLEEVTAWQRRPLGSVYPILYLDALQVKVKDQGAIRNKAIYLALGVGLTGEKELLGLWVSHTEGAKFWLQVLTELRNRGVSDIIIACVDGLTGFPEAIETAFPKTQVQLCIVHQVRNSLSYVSYKDRKAVAADMKKIYKSATLEEAEQHLASLGQTWNERYPTIHRSWDQHWEQLTAFFAFPPEIRKVIYTTNAIESLNSSMRKILKTRRAFPNDEAATKLMYLALQNIAKRWTRPVKDWKKALNQFAIMYEDRVPLP
jgi:putative transposase